MIPGANLGDRSVVFEAVYGSAPDIAGRGQANPVACVLSGALLLECLGEDTAGHAVEQAVRTILAEGRVCTPDLGGPSTTMDMAAAIIAALN